MSTLASSGLGTPRWQRSLLPAVLLGGIDPASGAPEGRRPRRSARDWLVDFTMFLAAIVIGVLANQTDWPQHGELFHVAAIVLGLACLAALWLRRAHPVAVAVFTAVASTASALGGGAAVLAPFTAPPHSPLGVGRRRARLALFTVAVHCRPRTVALVAVLSAVTVAIYPAVS